MRENCGSKKIIVNFNKPINSHGRERCAGCNKCACCGMILEEQDYAETGEENLDQDYQGQ